MRLAQKTVKSMGIVFASRIFGRIITFISKLVLARLLLPSDFGLVAIGMLTIEAIGLFRYLGIGQALIYKKSDINKAADTGFILIILTSVILFLFIYLSAPFVAIFFENSSVTNVVRVLGIIVILTALGSVPSVLLEKELDFKKRVVPEIVFTSVNAVLTIYLALTGFGFWSLVYGSVASNFIRLIAIWVVSPWRPTFNFDKKIAGELLGYGKYILGASILLFLVTTLDDAVVGKILGTTALGYYTVAYMISNLPATNITHLIGQVMFPVYSKLQDDREKLKRAYLKTLRYLSILSIPAAFGIFTIAPDFVIVVLGDKWTPAIQLIQILSFYGLIRSLGATTGDIFKTVGKPKYVQNITLINLTILAILVWPVTETYGLVGVSILVTISLMSSSIVAWIKVCEVIDLKILEIFMTLKNQFFCSVTSTVFTLSFIGIFMPNVHDIYSLASTFMVFSVCYLILVYIFDRNITNELRQIYPMIR